MNQGDGFSGPCRTKHKSCRRVATVKNRGQMANDPADLLFPNFPIEDLLEDCCPLIFREVFIIEVIRVGNKRF